MKKKWFSLLGIFLIVVGGVLILNSFSGMTGRVVLTGSSGELSSFLGVLVLIWGVFLLGGTREKIIRLYHAYPPGAYRPGAPLDASKSRHDGFYLAHSEEDAVLAFQHVHPEVDPMRIQVVEVDLSERLYGQLCVCELGEGVAEYVRIPMENFTRFNQALMEGHVKIKRAPVDLEALAAYS